LSSFRCYFMSGEHIQAVHRYECANDAEVILKANELLKAHPEHPAMEIWEGKRLVARLTKNPHAQTQQEGNVHVLHSKPK
jgi:hypothetical protein